MNLNRKHNRTNFLKNLQMKINQKMMMAMMMMAMMMMAMMMMNMMMMNMMIMDKRKIQNRFLNQFKIKKKKELIRMI